MAGRSGGSPSPTNRHACSLRNIFVRRVVELPRCATPSRCQVAAIRRGLCEHVPLPTLYLYCPTALELAVVGHPDIPFEMLKQSTNLRGFAADSDTAKWLWEVLEEFSPAERSLFLRFGTGSGTLPNKINVERNGGNANALPTASTCARTLCLPVYPSKAVLKEKLSIAICHREMELG